MDFLKYLDILIGLAVVMVLAQSSRDSADAVVDVAD